MHLLDPYTVGAPTLYVILLLPGITIAAVFLLLQWYNRLVSAPLQAEIEMAPLVSYDIGMKINTAITGLSGRVPSLSLPD